MKHYFFGLMMCSAFCLLTGCTQNQNGGAGSERDTTVNIRTDTSSQETVRAHAPVPPEMVSQKEDVNATGSIAGIRDKYLDIQKEVDAGTLRKDVVKYNCEVDPGSGELTRYFKDDEVVLVQLFEGEDHYATTKRFYLENGKPFFVYEQETKWQFGGPVNNTNPNTIDKVMEQRFYLKDGKVIRQLKKNYEVHSWETPVKSQDIANEELPVEKGGEYKGTENLPDLINGKSGC